MIRLGPKSIPEIGFFFLDLRLRPDDEEDDVSRSGVLEYEEGACKED